MKKIIISVLATLAMAQAQELPYKVFVQTFSDPNNPVIESTYKEVVGALKDYKNLRVVKRPSGKYHVVVVETIMDEGKFHKLYNKIKSLPEHGDAFFLSAPELLNDSTFENAKVASNGVNPMDKKEEITKVSIDAQAASPALAATEASNTPNEVRRVDTESAMISHSENPGKALSLKKSVDTLLVKNPNIKQRIYSYMEAGKDLDIAQRGYYPTLDFTGSIGMGRDKANEGTRNNETDWQDNVTKSAELRLVQNLYDGGVITNNKDQAISRMSNASYMVLEIADRTTLQMVDSYLNVIKEKTLLDLSAENIVTLEGIYDKIKERSDSGFGRKSEKQQAASRLTLAQSNFIAQQNAYDDALSTFQKLTGTMVDAEQLNYPEFIYVLPESVKIIEDKAMQCNPSVRAQEANIQLAKTILDGADAAYLPTLNLEAFASWRETKNYAYDEQRVDSYGALLRLNYNLFNKGIDMVTKEKRQVGIQKEQEVLDGIRDDLRESLKFSWQSYVLNNKKLGYIADHAKFSKETLDAYKEEFNIGRRELINVLDAENEYYNARTEIVTTERDLLYAKYRLLDNMGLLTDSFKPGFGKKYVKNACSIEADL